MINKQINTKLSQMLKFLLLCICPGLDKSGNQEFAWE
jgi:hypothetical protein